MKVSLAPSRGGRVDAQGGGAAVEGAAAAGGVGDVGRGGDVEVFRGCVLLRRDDEALVGDAWVVGRLIT